MRAYEMFIPDTVTAPSTAVARLVVDALIAAGATDVSAAMTINPLIYCSRRSLLVKANVPTRRPMRDECDDPAAEVVAQVVAAALDLAHPLGVASWNDPGCELTVWTWQGTLDGEVVAA